MLILVPFHSFFFAESLVFGCRTGFKPILYTAAAPKYIWIFRIIIAFTYHFS
jgi:hypothetical protein